MKTSQGRKKNQKPSQIVRCWKWFEPRLTSDAAAPQRRISETSAWSFLMVSHCSASSSSGPRLLHSGHLKGPSVTQRWLSSVKVSGVDQLLVVCCEITRTPTVNKHCDQNKLPPPPPLQGLDFWSYLLFIFYVLFSDDYGIFSDKLLFVLLSEVQDYHFFSACYIVATVWVKLSFFRDISVVTRTRHVLLALSCRKNVVNVISSPCSTTQQAPLPVLLRYCNKGLSHVTVWDQLRPVFYITTRWRYSKGYLKSLFPDWEVTSGRWGSENMSDWNRNIKHCIVVGLCTLWYKYILMYR